MKNRTVLAGLCLAIVAGSAHADAKSPTSSEQVSEKPMASAGGVGEIMSLQLMRHAKLWLAGSHANWPLADYELGELREGFEDASKLHPIYERVPVASLIANLTPAPLDAIGTAIKGKSAARFAIAFDGQTGACNACHQAANHGFIRITRPSGSMFSNQEFRPAPK
jgi:hypothetical protein